MSTYYSNGKLLLSGEYVVLDGATALVLPTKFGQSLDAKPVDEPKITWKSIDEKGKIWFKTTFGVSEGNIDFFESQQSNSSEGENKVLKRLASILNVANSLNPAVLEENNGFEITTSLSFPRNWGLGTSSTLINNIAQLFKIDAFLLLENTFKGSGFDIAAAKHHKPITYTLSQAGRNIFTSSFDPNFKDALFFVHLNKKQNSRDSIRHYKNQPKERLSEAVEKITAVTHKMASCTNLLEFGLLMEVHETIISQLIGFPKVKTQLFPDFPGSIKSLGGWGGDFILATGGKPEKDYFRRKGFSVVLDYEDMVL